ncbi:hypothetical protein DASC09_007060 [Saccharomycopsis crataegensis]|uniref:Uncharacterized protein n=1 Tax=Saccharomycopsis crataegensis TaxID=43959 RepID=A0AAV5QF76_9ASCO|nr:hypothetical protein DASC09_007060 [Saccharomycopsis crataegensis]
MSFESPKKLGKSTDFQDSEEDSSSITGKTPIKDKFRSMILKASHRTSTASFGSFNSKTKSFEVLAGRDNPQTSHLTVQTNNLDNSPDSEKKRESSSTFSETSTEFNSTSPLPPNSVMEADDDYEYYRYYYNYHQSQHPGASSHLIENFDTSGSSNEEHISGTFATTPTTKIGSPQFSRRNIKDEVMSKGTPRSSIGLSPALGVESKLDIISISTEGSDNQKKTNKHILSDDEEIERQKNEDERGDDIFPLSSDIRNLPQSSTSNRRISHPPSAISVNTFTTNESFHSALTDLNSEQKEGVNSRQLSMSSTEIGAEESQSALSSNSLTAPVIANERPRFSVNSGNTLNNMYSLYLNEPESVRNSGAPAPTPNPDDSRRGSSIYEGSDHRESTIGSSSNRNTATPSLLDAMTSEINNNPLPKLDNFGSTSTLSVRDKSTSLPHRRTVSHSTVSINSDDAKAAAAYASGARPRHSSSSTHSRSRSISSAFSSSEDISRKRESRASENAIGNISDHNGSQGFYFESEEPVIGNIGTSFTSQTSSQPKRFSNMYSKAQTKFPLLSSPLSMGISTPTSKKRDTATTTNTYSSYYGSNYRSSYQTNITSPTDTFMTGKNQSQQHTRIQSIDDPHRFDSYDKRLQELESDLNVREVDEDLEDEEDENENARKIISSGSGNNLDNVNDDSIFVPPYLNNTAHTQSSSFSSLRKGQESFKSSKSNNLTSAALAAATSAAATDAAIMANQSAISTNIPNLLTDDKKIFVKPVSYQQYQNYRKEPTIRSTSNSGYPKPSSGIHHDSYGTPDTHNKYQSGPIVPPTTPFSPLSIQNNKYIKSINDESIDQIKSFRDSTYSMNRGSKFKSNSKSNLRSFNLKPSLGATNENATMVSEGLSFDYGSEKYGSPGHSSGLTVCSPNTAILLLFIAIFVPPLYLVMCFGFLDPSVGYIQRKYKLIAAGMSMFITILSIVGICVGLGVGLA